MGLYFQPKAGIPQTSKRHEKTSSSRSCSPGRSWLTLKEKKVKLCLATGSTRAPSLGWNWVMESLCPFQIIKDPGFEMLMKTWRPGYYIPSASMVAHDVNTVFLKTRECITQMLQVS